METFIVFILFLGLSILIYSAGYRFGIDDTINRLYNQSEDGGLECPLVVVKEQCQKNQKNGCYACGRKTNV